MVFSYVVAFVLFAVNAVAKHLLFVSCLRRGHANLLCIIPMFTDDPRRESILPSMTLRISVCISFVAKLHNYGFRTGSGPAPDLAITLPPQLSE